MDLVSAQEHQRVNDEIRRILRRGSGMDVGDDDDSVLRLGTPGRIEFEVLKALPCTEGSERIEDALSRLFNPAFEGILYSFRG